jgi:hypothetical protein
VRVARLRDPALAAALPGGVLAGDEPEEGGEARRAEAGPVAQLDREREGGQRGDAAQTALFTRSPEARGILEGAATVQAIPACTQARARPYLVGPAS